MDDFEKIYNRCLMMECPPSEGNKKKVEGCFNAVNDYGQEPTDVACIKCWKNEFKRILL